MHKRALALLLVFIMLPNFGLFAMADDEQQLPEEVPLQNGVDSDLGNIGLNTEKVSGFYTGSVSPAMEEYLTVWLPQWKMDNDYSYDPSTDELQLVDTSFATMSRQYGDQLVTNTRSGYTMSNSYKSHGYYTNLQTAQGQLTGDQRTDIITIALSQYGYHEGNNASEYHGMNTSGTNDFTEYCNFFVEGSNFQWCAAFIAWCADQAGIDTTIIHKTAYATPSGNYTLGSFVPYPQNSTTPVVQPGDILCLGAINNTEGFHVGLVIETTSTTITFIDGNTDETRNVTTHELSHSGFFTTPGGMTWKITHYCSPNYHGWIKNNGYWYFTNSSGDVQTGWLSFRGRWYYLDPNNSGAMVTGWKQINGYWYYFNPQAGGPSGAMVTGWQLIGNNFYYFNSNGKMHTGWLEDNGYTYYLDPNSGGAMCYSWKQIGGNWYYFSIDGDSTFGAMLTGWRFIKNKWYYLGTNGAAVTGWNSINNYWYYFFETSDGPMCAMKTGWHASNGKWYYLSTDSATIGKMVTGWKTINGITYFFCRTTERDLGYGPLGSMLAGGTYEIDNVFYTFDSNGALQS